ncbi:hypothetical protein [Aquibacillus rhizosphaerae]|uniref:Hydrolase n=1 Tax=Aquibacillus rhizosphaerae TaxID=3051431 RepID=A0ABT7L2V6_9BACI|nr:hypothetical protein [Aquibacillus sp. LR5S19]MDL4840192.1 hypothetical protein [Aquibacillus sp. LR5S19]
MKKTYFISIDAGRIDKAKLDKNHTYFEVKVEENELYDLEFLLREVLSIDKDAKPVFSQPLSENDVDNERNDFQTKIEKLYRKIYEVGTEQTKSDISSLGILESQK